MTKHRDDLPETYGDLFTYSKDMRPNFTPYTEPNSAIDPTAFFAEMIV